MRYTMALVTAAALVASACGGRGPTLAEYAEQSEVLVTRVRAEIDALDAEWESQTPTVEGARVYWERRLEARVEFLEGIEALDPPEQLEEIHAYITDLFDRLITAERAVAAEAATYETLADHGPWWHTPAGEAARAVDGEAIAICLAAQEYFDATSDRALADVPWIPPEMKAAVRVAFGCPEAPAATDANPAGVASDEPAEFGAEIDDLRASASPGRIVGFVGLAGEATTPLAATQPFCSGAGGFEDISPGAAVIVRGDGDSQGQETILRGSAFDGPLGCSLWFGLDVAEADAYTITIGRHTASFDATLLESHGWIVHLWSDREFLEATCADGFLSPEVCDRSAVMRDAD